MKFVVLTLALLFTAAPAAAAVKSCEELNNEIEAKIKAKNVQT